MSQKSTDPKRTASPRLPEAERARHTPVQSELFLPAPPSSPSRPTAARPKTPPLPPARIPPEQSSVWPRDATTRTRAKPGPIRVGTSGYSFADWVGPFYPPGTKSIAMLEYYERHFNAVEINATYYRIPPPSTMRRIAGRTPSDFRFMVKLPGLLTHKRNHDIHAADEFRRAVAPMREVGKYAGALAQFPYSFRRSHEAESYLSWLRQSLADMPLFVEFRSASWDCSDLEAYLAALGVGFCSVDEPALTGLFPRRAYLVGKVAYVRFHGRNAADWWSGGPLRYDYKYAREELAQWTTLIQEMAQRADQTYIFFNNCHAGHAVLDARLMEELLGVERE